MTKDEDDWLSDFLEAAQAAARQSQSAPEKDYTAKLKLFTPRFQRARACDAQEELAKRLAASEALASQKKFDAASDALDGAFVLAGGLLAAAAAVDVEETSTEVEPAASEPTTIAEEVTEELPTEEPAATLEEPVAESAPEEPAAEINLDDLTAEAATEVAPAEATPEEPVAESASEEPASELNLDNLLGEGTAEGTGESAPEATPAEASTASVLDDLPAAAESEVAGSDGMDDLLADLGLSDSPSEAEPPVSDEKPADDEDTSPKAPDKPKKSRQA